MQGKEMDKIKRRLERIEKKIWGECGLCSKAAIIRVENPKSRFAFDTIGLCEKHADEWISGKLNLGRG